MMRKWIAVLSSILLLEATAIEGQNWAILERTGGPGTETIEKLAAGNNGAVGVAGTFDQGFNWQGISFSHTGGKDIFALSMAEDGTFRWSLHGGSILDDEVEGLAIDPFGNTVLAGTFWFEAQFEELYLEAGTNPKGIFLIKIDPDGQVCWGTAIGGTGIKRAGAVGADQAGNVWICGFFGGLLTIGDTTLAALGDTDLFLAKYSPEGQLLWALRNGQTADTRATALKVTPEGKAIVGGYFNGNTIIAGTALSANTSDRDAFLSAFDPDGQSLWALKAGGVHDDDLVAIETDEQGRIYAAGYFVGVMNLGTSVSIQSATGNPDFFLLKYDSSGTIIRARALGGLQSQLVTGLAVKGGRMAVCGYFQGAMSWDGFNLQSGAVFSGFAAMFNYDLEGTYAKAVPASAGMFVQQIIFDASGRLWMAGSFGGQATFPTGIVAATGPFDGFILATAVMVRATPSPAKPAMRLYPNPATDEIEITGLHPGDEIRVFDSSGRPCYGPVFSSRINFGFLPPGLYNLNVKRGKIHIVLAFVKM